MLKPNHGARFRRIRMSEFRKKLSCPSSFELADSISDHLDGDRGLQIANHLASCDFCWAEVDFYRHYPPELTKVPLAPEIPAPLHELAETLLNGETIHIKTLERLLSKG